MRRRVVLRLPLLLAVSTVLGSSLEPRGAHAAQGDECGEPDGEATCAAPIVQPSVAPQYVPAEGELGSPTNPIKMALVPTASPALALALAEPFVGLLEDATGLSFLASAQGNGYLPVIEAMGTEATDVAWLAPFAYVLAHERHGVEVALATIRQGSPTYRSQIVVRADSGTSSLEDLQGKRFAFVSPSSASGFLFPSALLASHGIDHRTFFAETIYAGGHPQAVLAVYNGQVDAAATYGNSREGGPPDDARVTALGPAPDVMEAVVPIAVTDPIPNDTVAYRHGLAPGLVVG